MAAQRAALLLSCYRRNEATDPDAYVAAVTLMLAQYPEYIVDRVTDPRRGLPSKSPFLPSAFDVRTECERLMAPFAEQERREQEARLKLPPQARDPQVDERIKAGFKKLIGQLEGGDRTGRPAAEADARRMKEGAEREMVRRHHMDRLEQMRAHNEAVPCRLSERALAAIKERDRIRTEEGI